MAEYPMTFNSTARAASGVAIDWQSTTADERVVTCSIPQEFAGPNTGFSPEDLYLMALMNCYVATLKVIAANSKLNFESLRANAKLILDRDAQNSSPWMKRAELKFTATGVEDEGRFRRVMERVSKQCMIINSVKTEVVFEFEVVPA